MIRIPFFSKVSENGTPVIRNNNNNNNNNNNGICMLIDVAISGTEM